MNLDAAKEIVLAEMVRRIVMDDEQRELLALAWAEFEKLVQDTERIDASYVAAALKRARRRMDADQKTEV